MVVLVPLWHRQRDVFYDAPVPADRCSGVRDRTALASLVLCLAAQDWLLVGYLMMLGLQAIVVRGPHWPLALLCLGGDLGVFVSVLWLVRGAKAPTTWLHGILYRLAVLVALLGSFFQLQWILPAGSGPPVDADLFALDLRLFGVEPSVAWDQYVRPATTEWFSFFYYGYFLLLAVHVFPAMFAGKNKDVIVPLGFGVLWLYCVGHVVYTIVPAYGPHAYLTFQHPLEGGVFWPLVHRTVVSAGARTDVFPSLHTAGPTFLALFSFCHRRLLPFKYTWPLLAFCAIQIIGATMFLRWHYLIDICAGLLLAVSAIPAGRVALWWDDARVMAGGPAVWPAFELPWKIGALVRR
jgi:hypothetical protein